MVGRPWPTALFGEREPLRHLILLCCSTALVLALTTTTRATYARYCNGIFRIHISYILLVSPSGPVSDYDNVG